MVNSWDIHHRYIRELWCNYREFIRLQIQFPSVSPFQSQSYISSGAFPLVWPPKQHHPPPKLFPQSRQAGCFLPLENSPFNTLEPQTPCTRSACPQSRSVRAAAPTPGWAMPKPFQCCRPGNSIRSAHKKQSTAHLLDR